MKTCKNVHILFIDFCNLLCYNIDTVKGNTKTSSKEIFQKLLTVNHFLWYNIYSQKGKINQEKKLEKFFKNLLTNTSKDGIINTEREGSTNGLVNQNNRHLLMKGKCFYD